MVKLWQALLERAAPLGTFNGQPLIPMPSSTTLPADRPEQLPTDFADYIGTAVQGNGVVFGATLARASLLSEVEFRWQNLTDRRLDETTIPAGMERPASLVWRADGDVTGAGNHYVVRRTDGLERLRPDHVAIARKRGARQSEAGPGARERVVAYLHWPDGTGMPDPKQAEVFLPDEVAHWMPYPDPLHPFRGMSWLTPVAREIIGDVAMSRHKLKFFDNAAIPSLFVQIQGKFQGTQREEFKKELHAQYGGLENAGKSLVLDSGADVTPLTFDLRQLEFAATQAAGENRIAVASGVPAVILGIKEGLAGSSLNAGNYGQSMRRFADLTIRPLWRSLAEAYEGLLPPKPGHRLWYADRHIAALQQDAKDESDIKFRDAQSLRQLIDAGYEPDAAVEFMQSGDLRVLDGKHSGLYSVQLQKPGSTTTDPAAGA